MTIIVNTRTYEQKLKSISRPRGNQRLKKFNKYMEEIFPRNIL